MNINYAAQYKDEDISELEKEIFKDGLLTVKPYSFYKNLSENLIKNLLVKKAIYVLPTTELMEWLKNNIEGFAIEIGSGNGAIGRNLDIPMTDNKMQNWEHIKLFYKTGMQPTIIYPIDIEELDAIAAIDKYKPDTVVAGFMTHRFNGTSGNAHGPDEKEIYRKVKKYIMIGNLITHKDNSLMKLPHLEFFYPWLITRGINQKRNRIFIFENNSI